MFTVVYMTVKDGSQPLLPGPREQGPDRDWNRRASWPPEAAGVDGVAAGERQQFDVGVSSAELLGQSAGLLGPGHRIAVVVNDEHPLAGQSVIPGLVLREGHHRGQQYVDLPATIASLEAAIPIL